MSKQGIYLLQSPVNFVITELLTSCFSKNIIAKGSQHLGTRGARDALIAENFKSLFECLKGIHNP